MTERLYTVEEVAALLRVHGSTVRRWIASGQMSAIRLPRGTVRISEGELERVRGVPA